MSITLFIGPMFSGKTSTLIGQYRTNCTVAFKHVADVRYSKDMIVSHDGLAIPALSCSRLPYSDTFEASVSIVLIDEGQFFSNLAEAAMEYAERNFNVYVAALSGTSDLTPWTSVSKLIPICDDITHMKAKLCMRCRKSPAAFTSVVRGFVKDMDVEIGGADKYEPVCRSCITKKQI